MLFICYLLVYFAGVFHLFVSVWMFCFVSFVTFFCFALLLT